MEKSTPVASSRAWQSKNEWVILVENIAQSRARLASGIQLAIEKQWGNNFAATLQEYAASKENEIRDVCSSNYQEFVDSIEEIHDIDRFQSELTGATSGVLSIHDSLATCYTIQKHIDDSIEKLQQCQRIAALAASIENYIQQGKLFHALKILEELRVEIAAFRGRLFPQRMSDWMHVAMKKIKEEAKRNASVWLEEIRASSLSIGESAIHRLENQISEQYYEQDILEKCSPAPGTGAGQLRQFMSTDTFDCVQVAPENLTAVVVKSCKNIEALVQMMFDYERYLNIDDWGEWVRDDTIEALGFLNCILNEMIDQHTDLQVSTAVMMGTNASFLACACDRLEELVKVQTEAWEASTYGYSVSNTLRGADTQLVKPCSSRLLLSKAAAKKKFESTMTRAQDMVCELMLKKIDELLSSFYYLNWTPSAVLTQPDPSMWDLINYLKVTFAQLGQLPPAVQEAVHFASCSYLAKSLEQILSGATVKKLNMEGIASFKRNLDVLLDFIESVPIAQLKDCFVPITHLVDLFVSGAVEAFLDPLQRDTRKYSHLSSDTVSAVLAKMKDGKSSSKAWGATFVHAPKSIFGARNIRK
ncbi:hypothetical protein BBO99_00004318 [Phytophthora kernoviae]|uniref:Uncharacterized protein n=2 Tax=Phytophthora kernoviae TaxID=325452 RepID=A0A3R7J8Q5_9STRA|nr:hypothetical protein G195_006337 [Phytophthora kernoviae 00238/432]KAG2525349.1 hypothetical protein JM16_004512 [Phytophthora kernoviae]KAG2527098.1 hypothetical protein JM18_004004 [Phytophthora kernoviae]RLN20767.1 hypothetical protein BBI17_004418 [Phytophthora kernoviae]RLN80683.1 hypothetical protein BBO99_00004318 [Phytophthora kernoviae]